MTEAEAERFVDALRDFIVAAADEHLDENSEDWGNAARNAKRDLIALLTKDHE